MGQSWRPIYSPPPPLFSLLCHRGGLIRGDANVDLTTEGENLFESLRQFVAGPTARLLGQFDPEDINTTLRTLQAITAKAAEELAAG